VSLFCSYRRNFFFWLWHMCDRVNRYKILSVYSSLIHIQVNFSFVITYKIMFCQVLILIQLYVIMNKRAKQ
jgi:hypothetical protein